MKVAIALGLGVVLVLPGVLLRAAETDTDIARAAEALEAEAQPAAASIVEMTDDDAAIIARGAYLVSIADCSGCHTPLMMTPEGPRPDMTRFLSGHPQEMAMPAAQPPDGPWNALMAATATAFAGPWGVSYAINLTPDVQTGLGTWTQQMFIDTLRTGRHMATSRPIMPPMPWMAYGHMTDEDLAAVFAYLQSLPAISNQAPDSVPAASAAEAADPVYGE